MKLGKEGKWKAKAYLCESALVQNFLLELRDFQRRYAARVVPPGGPEKGRRRRSQAGRLRETAFRPSWCANHRPWMKHWGSNPDDLLSGSNAVIAGELMGVMHVAAWSKWS